MQKRRKPKNAAVNALQFYNNPNYFLRRGRTIFCGEAERERKRERERENMNLKQAPHPAQSPT